MARLDEHCALPTGMWVGDENMPNQEEPTSQHHHPSRGAELCGVVEAMYSYAVMFGTFGEPSTLDRAERIAYNALPATWASPKGGDMWAHQYLQAVNQIEAKLSDPHVWTHDGPDSERYGLEPNFGCCTANFNQGWPKFAQNVFWLTPDGGAAVGILAPAEAALPASAVGGGGSIAVDTSFPFEDEVRMSASAAGAAFPLYIRVPGWAAGDGGSAQLVVDGQPPVDLTGKNGTLAKVGTVPAGGTLTATLQLTPKLRVEQWAVGGYSVHRGALMYSYPVAGNYSVVEHHFGDDDMSNTYDTSPLDAWRFALQVDPARPEESLSFESSGLVAGAAPFNHTNFPLGVHATLRALPSWGIELNSAAEPPASPACADASKCGPPQSVVLVPYGMTDLRIGQFPLA